MRVLGAILAGGKSQRFGSDKAHALHDGRCLMAHCVEALRRQVDDLVVCGRAWTGLVSLPDRPAADVGPLGGLNAALHHPGFDAVLCVPVDVHPLPMDLRAMLEGSEARVLASQHAIGFWPTGLGPALDVHLARGHRAIGGWIAHSDAVRVPDAGLGLVNINRRGDLAMLAA